MAKPIDAPGTTKATTPARISAANPPAGLAQPPNSSLAGPEADVEVDVGKTRRLVESLTVEEKARLTVGRNGTETNEISRAGVRSVRMVDGPHGVRAHADAATATIVGSMPATCFPPAVTMGSTWNRELIREVGVALGVEAAAAGVDVLLGPGTNLKRTPLGGRNFEYLSEDPHLSSALSSAWVNGLQSTGVGASLKHFAANNAEQRRYGVSTYVDERALRELYLASFEHTVITEKPATIMAAYSKLNGVHCTENTWLLTDLLRKEWGYTGTVISDWGAAWDGVASLAAGTDLVMPGPLSSAAIARAVTRGDISSSALDAAASRVITLSQHALRNQPATPELGNPSLLPVVGKARKNGGNPYAVDHQAHHVLARKVAADGTVLLKNDAGLLPLATGQHVAIIGSFAAEPRYQGGGSSNVVPTQLDDLLSSMRTLVGEQNISYAPGYDRRTNTSDTALRDEAATVAAAADVAVLLIGLPEAFESEGVDRSHMHLPDAHNELVTAVLAANPGLVVVFIGGSPVEMPWLEKVQTVVGAFLGGQAGGSALAEVLTGAAEPGGRLAESFTRTYEDHPVATMPNGPQQIEYWESIYLGYRYFETARADLAFPFGHGLSYTSFTWSDLTVSESVVTDSPDLKVTVSLTLTNTGFRPGSDVVQLYVHDTDCSTHRPAKELRGFEKITLNPGESRTISLQLDRRAFAYWSTTQHDWVVEPGQFDILLGASARDIRLTSSMAVTGDVPPISQTTAEEPYWHIKEGASFTRTAFQTVYGGPLPANTPPRRGRFTLDTALQDMKETAGGALIFRYMRHAVIKELGIKSDDPLLAIADAVVGQINFRMFPTLTGGTINPKIARGILHTVNVLSLIPARRGVLTARPPRRQLNL